MEEKRFQYDSLFMLIKFGSKENLEKLQNGELFMNNLLYYINEEKESTVSGERGDAYEGQRVVNNPTVRISDPDTGVVYTQFKANYIKESFGYEKCPVFCMFSLDSRNHRDEKITDGKLIEGYRFSNEQIEKMSKSFGEHALMLLDADEFITRVNHGLRMKGFPECQTGFVRYYGPNELEHFKDVSMNRQNVVFWKRQIYSYQQEFRLLVLKNSETSLTVDIGKIHDISELVKTRDLLHSQLDFLFDIPNGVDTHAL